MTLISDFSGLGLFSTSLTLSLSLAGKGGMERARTWEKRGNLLEESHMPLDSLNSVHREISTSEMIERQQPSFYRIKRCEAQSFVQVVRLAEQSLIAPSGPLGIVGNGK